MDIIKNIKILQNQFRTGNYLDVIRGCKKILKVDPINTYVLNLCGLSLQNIGEELSAINFFKEAIAHDRNNFAAMNNLANSYKAQYEYGKAEEFYLLIIKKDPNNLKAINNYANLKHTLGHFSEAIELYLKAIKINSNEPSVLFSLAASYQSAGEFEKSKEIINKILELYPKSCSAHKMLSAFTNYEKDNEGHLNKMLTLSKDNTLKIVQKIDLFYALGKAKEDTKDYEDSFGYLEKANLLQKEMFPYKIEEDEKIFNSIIKIFGEIDFSQFKKKPNKKEIIFICGMPRSGTTLVEQIIASHNEVSGAGELIYLEHTIQNNFFNNIDLDKKKIIVEGLSQKNILESEYMKLLNFHNFNLKKITDKAPQNFRWIGFLKIFFPNCKIIHCSRNPKDNCLSVFKNSFGSNHMGWSYSQKDIATYYNLYLKMMSFWKTKFKNSIYELKYENLVNNSDDEIQKLIKFCDLEWDANCLNFYENKKTPIKTVSIAQARKPIYKSSLNSNIDYSKHLQEMYNILDIN